MNTKLDNFPRMRTALLSLAAATLMVPLAAGAYGSKDAGEAGKGKDDKSMQKQTEKMTESMRDTASDIRMHVALESKFAQSDELSSLAIGTDVKDGVVHLDGEVETAARKEMATELAKSVDGVKSVRNDLKVTDKEPGMLDRLQDAASDTALTARVKSRLLASDNTSGLAISVSTEDLVVTLEGDVESDTERELAELIAANTSGVSDVRNELKVKSN